jgi:hypothetical protein
MNELMTSGNWGQILLSRDIHFIGIFPKSLSKVKHIFETENIS